MVSLAEALATLGPSLALSLRQTSFTKSGLLDDAPIDLPDDFVSRDRQ
jgi:hypothetical protein